MAIVRHTRTAQLGTRIRKTLRGPTLLYHSKSFILTSIYIYDRPLSQPVYINIMEGRSCELRKCRVWLELLETRFEVSKFEVSLCDNSCRGDWQTFAPRFRTYLASRAIGSVHWNRESEVGLKTSSIARIYTIYYVFHALYTFLPQLSLWHSVAHCHNVAAIWLSPWCCVCGALYMAINIIIWQH